MNECSLVIVRSHTHKENDDDKDNDDDGGEAEAQPNVYGDSTGRKWKTKFLLLGLPVFLISFFSFLYRSAFIYFQFFFYFRRKMPFSHNPEYKVMQKKINLLFGDSFNILMASTVCVFTIHHHHW